MLDKDAADVLVEEFAKPRTAYLPRTQSLVASYGDNGRKNRAATSIFWKDIITADDQLRQRMVFALSQILVVSDNGMGDQPERLAYYMDVLGENAFGNYRDLLKDVTYSPAMGYYLSYKGNRKGDPRTGRLPDENYAREIMQLFTIGLVELDMDGTPKLDANGETIETYSNDDIMGLARVFTGLNTLDPATGQQPANRYYVPMKMNQGVHSTLEKSFLGKTIPEGTPGVATIDQAIDILFEHPNVAPFVSRQLIQRFTASNPDPSYVRRVAESFEAGQFTSTSGVTFGTGERGDLEATLAAVVLDASQFSDGVIRNTTDLGKVREPILNFVQWARAFEVDPVVPEDQWNLLYNASDVSSFIGQQPFNSPSVFNFYRPGFSPVGTESGEAGLTVPEFQLLLGGNRAGYINMMTEYIWDNTYGPEKIPDNFKPDYDEALSLVREPEKLADHLDERLLGGRMADSTRQTIVDMVAAIPIRVNNPDNTAYDEFARVASAILATVTSPEYMIR